VCEGDTVARFGSDEFGVLVEGLQAPAEASLVANRLLAEPACRWVAAARPPVGKYRHLARILVEIRAK
jgi:GGDEF domain-containing protein